MKKLVKSLILLGSLSLIITSCGSNAQSSSARPNTYTIVWKNEDGILLPKTKKEAEELASKSSFVKEFVPEDLIGAYIGH